MATKKTKEYIRPVGKPADWSVEEQIELATVNANYNFVVAHGDLMTTMVSQIDNAEVALTVAQNHTVSYWTLNALVKNRKVEISTPLVRALLRHPSASSIDLYSIHKRVGFTQWSKTQNDVQTLTEIPIDHPALTDSLAYTLVHDGKMSKEDLSELLTKAMKLGWTHTLLALLSYKGRNMVANIRQEALSAVLTSHKLDPTTMPKITEAYWRQIAYTLVGGTYGFTDYSVLFRHHTQLKVVFAKIMNMTHPPIYGIMHKLTNAQLQIFAMYAEKYHGEQLIEYIFDDTTYVYSTSDCDFAEARDRITAQALTRYGYKRHEIAALEPENRLFIYTYAKEHKWTKATFDNGLLRDLLHMDLSDEVIEALVA